MKSGDLEYFNHLVKIASEHFDIDETTIRSKNGKRHIVDIKRMIVALFRPVTRMSLGNIGFLLSVKHCTVIHYTSGHQTLYGTDRVYTKSFDAFKKKVMESSSLNLPLCATIEMIYKKKKEIENLFVEACANMDMLPEDVIAKIESQKQKEDITTEKIHEPELV